MKEPKVFVVDHVVSKHAATDPSYGERLLQDVGNHLLYDIGKSVVSEALRYGPQVVAVTYLVSESEGHSVWGSVLVQLKAQVMCLADYLEWAEHQRAPNRALYPQEKYAGTNAPKALTEGDAT